YPCVPSACSIAMTVTCLPRTLSGTSFTKRRTGSEVLPNAFPIRKHTTIGRSILLMHFFILRRPECAPVLHVLSGLHHQSSLESTKLRATGIRIRLILTAEAL